ncbi:MAG: ABC transporter ATP-binding protein [Rikenellaceae bacterium]|nr:ABC transporter ATP-binding protein [Rikenellaceae bacterium]
MELIALHNVTVAYQAEPVLKGVNLTISDGDFVGVIGPNGGGKTTLVKAILGQVAYSGRVDYAPEVLRDGVPAIGYLPQQNLFDRAFPISVREVVLSGLQSRRRWGVGYNREDDRRVAETLRIMDLEGLANRPIGEISGGQMQRALLCRAVISEPRVLILDEPTTYVDNRFEGELYELLERLSSRMAIVVVSHDIGTITSKVRSIVCVNRTVHRHDSNIITPEQLANYNCPIQIISHGNVPHTVLEHHDHHHHDH